ncbi:MAG: hypothetical protein KY460_13375 [Actinobacteria bacterium]|nr:hypothetical protein [Actinomycetota bacterium]
MERITVWLARIGFLSIAACTFGLSFDAIRDVARTRAPSTRVWRGSCRSRSTA